MGVFEALPAKVKGSSALALQRQPEKLGHLHTDLPLLRLGGAQAKLETGRNDTCDKKSDARSPPEDHCYKVLREL